MYINVTFKFRWNVIPILLSQSCLNTVDSMILLLWDTARWAHQEMNRGKWQKYCAFKLTLFLFFYIAIWQSFHFNLTEQ